jgi:hypothetical protein
MVIVKSRSNAQDWMVWHTTLLGTEFLYLNGTNAKSTLATVWNSTVPSSTVFSLGTQGNINTNGATQVAYCFAPVAGYSAFGSYTGNGSANGPFVYLGFRPRWLMVKRTDSTSNWHILDTSRSTYNASNSMLFPNLSNAEATDPAYNFDILSNGFKLRTVETYLNGSGATYIYYAVAENPFAYSNAR